MAGQLEGITGLWIPAQVLGRCSACEVPERKTLHLSFGEDVFRLCVDCATAMRDLLIDALEDDQVSDSEESQKLDHEHN